jgi:predicted transposase/invertase (TIGR01784 family)
MEVEYMTILERDRLNREEGIEQGIQIGLKQGLKQGLSQGLTQGLTQGKLEVAKNLIQNGVDENIISISTDLTIEEVRELKKKYMN